MSREVDLTKPLSDEDREYLQNNNRLTDIARADGKIGEDGFPLPDDSVEGSHVQSPQQTDPSLGAVTTVPEQPLEPGQIGVQPQSADAGDAEAPSDNYDDEDAWSYRELQEEAGKREDVPATGSREALIEALRKDDAKPAQS